MFAASRRPTAALRPVNSSVSSSYKSSCKNRVKKPPTRQQRPLNPFEPLLERLPSSWALPAPLTADLLDSYYDGDEDDYEGDIIVNSVELGPSMRSIGVEHYLEQVAKFDHDDFPRADAADYTQSDTAMLSSTVHSKSESRTGEEETGPEIMMPRGWPWRDEKIDYTESPLPAPECPGYRRDIYKATTINPAVFLAIIRIAEKNLPFINFNSAISHLPNLRPQDPLPKLRQGVLYAQEKKRPGDVDMFVTFLPYFYRDGRHALGYYALSPEPNIWSSSYKADGSLFVKNAFFTPCTTRDLDVFDLIEYMSGQKGTASSDGQEVGVDCMNSVAARRGKWLAWGVDEDWEDWDAEINIVKVLWELDLLLTTGNAESNLKKLVSEVEKQLAG
ncbi:armadillo-like helical [Pyrenophora seminiperda CCB06]|uniref:Armadillo-like helical n=1 Tax=Pyrenophora seminiperda CCB06 TaxID=1302712 RepID=A0A3M7M911_9PLEO|nr:armadillo-like helical [Pyrenophora seminiperda CCB06]